MNNSTEINCSSCTSNVSTVSSVNNETIPDLVWSEIGKVWISKTEFAKDDEQLFKEEEDSQEEEETEWSDDDSYDSSRFTNKSRRRQSWQDIAIASSLASRTRLVVEEETEVVTEEANQECTTSECTSECAICYDCFTKTDACSTTPCGHKFHSKCLFQNFEHRPECPLCRTELIKQPEEEDDEEEESSYYSEEEEDEEPVKQIASIKQMANKLASLGYTMEDLLMLHFGGSDHPKDIANPRWANDLNPDENGSTETTNSTISSVGSHIKQYDVYEQIYKEPNSMLEKLTADIENIMEGNLGVDYKDTRTYAQVLAAASVANQ